MKINFNAYLIARCARFNFAKATTAKKTDIGSRNLSFTEKKERDMRKAQAHDFNI